MFYILGEYFLYKRGILKAITNIELNNTLILIITKYFGTMDVVVDRHGRYRSGGPRFESGIRHSCHGE